MKLTVIGGGGVRSPFLARTLVNNAESCNITELVFMDIDQEKLELFGSLSSAIAKELNPDISFSLTTDPVEAIKDADYVITTIREAGDIGRVKDEQIAQKYNVFGQETTGVGGFCFSLRSIPVLVEYMNLVKDYAHKDCIVFNFTNPAGLVTECLVKLGFKNVYGICDGPMEFQRQISEKFSQPSEFSCTWYGLNHLSYMRNMRYKGQDYTKELINDDSVYENTELKLIDKGLSLALGDEFINEYLYFFYYQNKVMDSLQHAQSTRGQDVLEINKKMMQEMKKNDLSNTKLQFEIFNKYLNQRENTYFTLESGEQRVDLKKPQTYDDFINEKDDGGYAGVALNFIRGFSGSKDITMTLLVKNENSLNFLESDQVIEISCDISKGKISKHIIDNVGSLQKQMITQIKVFEDFTTKAIINKSKSDAIKALMVHPLINSYDLAVKLLDEIFVVYPEYTQGWE